MSLAKMPVVVKEFFRALERRDSEALRACLAPESALVEEAGHYCGEAFHAWCEGFLADTSLACHPTYALHTGGATTVIVLRTGAAPAQQRWRFETFRGKVSLLTIAAEALPSLPAPVLAYVNATNTGSFSALLATFADDALVNDQLQDFVGKKAIAEWAARDIIGVRLTMYVVKALQQHGHVVVTAHVDGHFDKSGLPEPLVLTFYFSSFGDELVQLIILRNQAGI
jgi:hypothetical protein